MSYSRVNWIQSTKTYWDAGVAPGANPKIFADFEIIGLDASQGQDVGIVGVNSPYHYSSPTFMMLACTGRTNFSVYVGGYNWVDYAGQYTFNQRWQGTLTTSSYSFINLDDHSYDSSGSIAGNHSAGSRDYYIGARAENNTQVYTGGTYKWYEIILYENNVEVAHFLPYRDDETGYGVFYETVSGRYMPAYEPSAVIAGPLLYPEYTSTFTSDGGTDTYSLETEASWSAVSDSNWLIVSPISGTGDETLSITVKKNSDYDSGRTGTVTVTNTNNNILLVWTVEQERKKYLIKLMNLWKNGAPINKLMIDEDSRYQSFVNLGAVSGNTIEYTTTGGTMIQVPRTGWGSPLLSNTYDTNGGKLVFLGQPTAIAPNAFSGSDITTFTVPDSVSAIGANAFAECAEIEEITLGENIASLGAGAFSGCSNLAYIEAESDTAPSISADTFYGVAEGGTLKHNPGTDYSTWMSDDPYYLGYYGWEEEAEDYSTKYFTLVSLEDNNTLSFRVLSSYITMTYLAYSTDNGNTWTTGATSRGVTVSVTANTGDKVLLKGVAAGWGWSGGTVGDTPIVNGTKTFDVEGNIMSLVYGDNFTGQTSIPSNVPNTFGWLFKHCTTVRDCSNLVCPATTLGNRTYAGMFCGSTVTALPQLAAESALIASNASAGTYQHFAHNCTALTSVELNLAFPNGAGQYALQSFFQGCTNLTAVTGTITFSRTYSESLEYMFDGCTKLKTAPKFLADTLTKSGLNDMQYMFQNCSELDEITFTGNARNNYLWVNNVAATGTFYKNPEQTFEFMGASDFPSGWTVVDYSE